MITHPFIVETERVSGQLDSTSTGSSSLRRRSLFAIQPPT
jgi:hypothetical protein